MNKRSKQAKFDRMFLGIMRERRNLTWQALADKIQSSKSYIWELANTKDLEPSGSFVYRLAKALRCKMEDFYEDVL